MSIMYKTIEDLCKKNNITITEMCRELKINRSSLSELKQGRAKSLSVDKVIKIADFFNVSANYITGIVENKIEKMSIIDNQNYIDADVRRIQRARKNMPAKEKEKMIAMLVACFDEYFTEDYLDDDNDE